MLRSIISRLTRPLYELIEEIREAFEDPEMFDNHPLLRDDEGLDPDKP